MIEFINPYTKTAFLVADDRVDEYKAAGFPLAANTEKPKVEVIKETKTEEKAEETKKTVRRSTRKK